MMQAGIIIIMGNFQETDPAQAVNTKLFMHSKIQQVICQRTAAHKHLTNLLKVSKVCKKVYFLVTLLNYLSNTY